MSGFEIIDNKIYFQGVEVATINPKLVPSFRDRIENVLKNDFYSPSEITEIKEAARKHESPIE